MKYPTIEEVHKANKVQLARWYRFLTSPGVIWVEHKDFEVIAEEERRVMSLIMLRFKQLGGMNPLLSKQIRWKE